MHVGVSPCDVCDSHKGVLNDAAVYTDGDDATRGDMLAYCNEIESQGHQLRPWKNHTYMRPTANTLNTSILCRVCICSFHTTGIGIVQSNTSVMTFKALNATASLNRSIQ